MPNCYWQLGLGPLISRNQEGLYCGTRHFECIEACDFSNLRFSASRLFRLSAFSDSLPLQAFAFHVSPLRSPPSFRIQNCGSYHRVLQVFHHDYHLHIYDLHACRSSRLIREATTKVVIYPHLYIFFPRTSWSQKLGLSWTHPISFIITGDGARAYTTSHY